MRWWPARNAGASGVRWWPAMAHLEAVWPQMLGGGPTMLLCRSCLGRVHPQAREDRGTAVANIEMVEERKHEIIENTDRSWAGGPKNTHTHTHDVRGGKKVGLAACVRRRASQGRRVRERKKKERERQGDETGRDEGRASQ